jgi:hypothetical protein
MLGIGAIEIEEATYSLGMCGHIVVRINESGKRYRINHSMSDGWQVSEAEGRDEWCRSKRMEPEAFIALLPKDRGWAHNVFIAVWAGFASGYEKGREEGRYMERERQTVPCAVDRAGP